MWTRIYSFLESRGIEDLKPNTKVSYEIYMELLGEFDCTPEERGFDYITVKTLSHSAKGFFRK